MISASSSTNTCRLGDRKEYTSGSCSLAPRLKSSTPRGSVSVQKNNSYHTVSDRERARNDALQRTIKSRHGHSSHEESFAHSHSVSLPPLQEVIRRINNSESTGFQDTNRQPTSLSVFNRPDATYAWPNLTLPPFLNRGGDEESPRRRDPITRMCSQSGSARPGVCELLDSVSLENELPLSRYGAESQRSISSHRSSISSLAESIGGVSFVHRKRSSSTATTESDSFDSHYEATSRRPYNSSVVSVSHRAWTVSSSPPSSISRESSVDSIDDGMPQQEMSETLSQDWKDHAGEAMDQDGKTIFECLWPVLGENGQRACGYAQKKQLVKRHIETRHLRIKRFVCYICQKAFPQKTSLDIHLCGHTGAKPHQCLSCDMTFKDPARKHRHEVVVHGKKPRERKKAPKVVRIENQAAA